jgi:hypothetical protein
LPVIGGARDHNVMRTRIAAEIAAKAQMPNVK